MNNKIARFLFAGALALTSINLAAAFQSVQATTPPAEVTSKFQPESSGCAPSAAPTRRIATVVHTAPLKPLVGSVATAGGNTDPFALFLAGLPSWFWPAALLVVLFWTMRMLDRMHQNRYPQYPGVSAQGAPTPVVNNHYYSGPPPAAPTQPASAAPQSKP